MLLFLTSGDYGSNYSSIFNLYSTTAFKNLEPNPIYFGVFAVILGIFIIMNSEVAAGLAYCVGAFSLVNTTLFFVLQQHLGIDIPLTQVTNTLLWIGGILIIAGSIEAIIIDPENRSDFLWFSLVFVISFALVFFIGLTY